MLNILPQYQYNNWANKLDYESMNPATAASDCTKFNFHGAVEDNNNVKTITSGQLNYSLFMTNPYLFFSWYQYYTSRDYFSSWPNNNHNYYKHGVEFGSSSFVAANEDKEEMEKKLQKKVKSGMAESDSQVSSNSNNNDTTNSNEINSSSSPSQSPSILSSTTEEVFCNQSSNETNISMGALLSHSLKQRRKRRHRTIFNEKQLTLLEESFSSCPYPDIIERETLGNLLGLKEERIEIWFKNRRAKVRKQSLLNRT